MGTVATPILYAKYLQEMSKKEDYMVNLFESVKKKEITMNKAYKISNFKGTFAEFTELASQSGYLPEVMADNSTVYEKPTVAGKTNKPFPYTKVILVVATTAILVKIVSSAVKK